MWWILLLILVALIVIKVWTLSKFWASYDIPYESYPSYLYRVIWRYNTGIVVNILRENVQRYGPVYGSYRGFKPSLIVSDLNLAKEVLVKQFANFFSRSLEFQTGDPLWDHVIFNLPHKEWKALRAVMGHTLTGSKMRGIIPKFDKVSKRLVGQLEGRAKSTDNTLCLKTYFKAYAIDSMAAVSFGMDPNSIENPDNSFVKHAEQFLKPGFTMFLFFMAPKLVKYIPFADFPARSTTEFFGKVGLHALKEKRKNLDEVIANGTADILDLHLIAQRENPQHLTDEILASQAFIFISGGIDGTTLSLEHVMYNFAVHPDAQQKAFDELMAVLKGRTEIKYEDVQALKYLEACILESLRVAPLMAIFDRICTADTYVHGIKITKEMIVEFPVPSIHMDPKYFPEPERFLPERFLRKGDIAEEQDISAFLTFGEGPKKCVGRRLALINTLTLLANILLKIRVERAPETPYPIEVKTGFQFTDFEKRPLLVRIMPRNETPKL